MCQNANFSIIFLSARLSVCKFVCLIFNTCFCWSNLSISSVLWTVCPCSVCKFVCLICQLLWSYGQFFLVCLYIWVYLSRILVAATLVLHDSTPTFGSSCKLVSSVSDPDTTRVQKWDSWTITWYKPNIKFKPIFFKILFCTWIWILNIEII